MVSYLVVTMIQDRISDQIPALIVPAVTNQGPLHTQTIPIPTLHTDLGGRPCDIMAATSD